MEELDSNLKNHSNVTDFIGQTSDSKKFINLSLDDPNSGTTEVREKFVQN